jgi:Arc/MetJ family transcription regulator
VPTNLDIDQDLLERARLLGHHRSERETVNAALREYVYRRGLLKALEAFGTIDFDPKWDYRQERSRSRA